MEAGKGFRFRWIIRVTGSTGPQTVDVEIGSMSQEEWAASKPLVTVVIPSYNRAQYIAQTIESVLAQTYKNLEVIVIDDGSTDNTRAVVSPYCSSRLQYVWRENAERGASRNRGLTLARGEYISFLDSDDLWLPKKVEQDVAFFQRSPEVGVVYTDSIQIDADGRELRPLPAPSHRGHVTAALLKSNFVSIGAHLIRTALVRQIGGYLEERQLSGAEDWEMWVRLSLVAKFAHNPVATTKIRTHPLNTMTNSEAMCRCLSRATDLFAQNPDLRTKHKDAVRSSIAHANLVNAINFRTATRLRRSAGFLKAAAATQFSIVLDPRFAYTLVRLITDGLGLTRSRGT